MHDFAWDVRAGKTFALQWICTKCHTRHVWKECDVCQCACNAVRHFWIVAIDCSKQSEMTSYRWALVALTRCHRKKHPALEWNPDRSIHRWTMANHRINLPSPNRMIHADWHQIARMTHLFRTAIASDFWFDFVVAPAYSCTCDDTIICNCVVRILGSHRESADKQLWSCCDRAAHTLTKCDEECHRVNWTNFVSADRNASIYASSMVHFLTLTMIDLRLFSWWIWNSDTRTMKVHVFPWTTNTKYYDSNDNKNEIVDFWFSNSNDFDFTMHTWLTKNSTIFDRSLDWTSTSLHCIVFSQCIWYFLSIAWQFSFYYFNQLAQVGTSYSDLCVSFVDNMSITQNSDRNEIKTADNNETSTRIYSMDLPAHIFRSE